MNVTCLKGQLFQGDDGKLTNSSRNCSSCRPNKEIDGTINDLLSSLELEFGTAIFIINEQGPML
jgi:hypothetical protein